MKMTGLEKALVNHDRHVASVIAHERELLREVPVRAGASYLDVGCGNGAATLAIGRELGLEVTGIDVDPAQVAAARAAALGTTARFEVGDATSLPFAACRFDIVACHRTTHHIPAWEAAIAESLRVLRPGGWLVYTDLLLPPWAARWGRRLAGRWAGFVTESGLRSALARAHARVEYRRRAGFVLELVARRCDGQCARAGLPCPARRARRAA